MQSKIDWATGGLQFYELDPPKNLAVDQFKPAYDINKDFDPIPSMWLLYHSDCRSTKE